MKKRTKRTAITRSIRLRRIAESFEQFQSFQIVWTAEDYLLINRSVDSSWRTTKRRLPCSRLGRRRLKPPGYGSVVRRDPDAFERFTICAYWSSLCLLVASHWLCTAFAYPLIAALCGVTVNIFPQVLAVGIWDWRSFELKSNSKIWTVKLFQSSKSFKGTRKDSSRRDFSRRDSSCFSL